MLLEIGKKYLVKQKFSVGKDAVAVHIAKGDVAVCKEVRGVKMYFVRGRYLTDLFYGKYFMEDVEEI